MRVLNNDIAICTASDLPITTDGSIKAYILEDSVELYMLTDDKFCKVYVTLDMFDDLVEGKYVVENNEDNIPMLYHNDNWTENYRQDNLSKFYNNNIPKKFKEDDPRLKKLFWLIYVVGAITCVSLLIATMCNILN